MILTVMVSSTKSNARKPASRCVNVAKTIPKDGVDPLRANVAVNRATGDLVVLKAALAAIGDLVVLKAALAAIGDLVVLKAAPAVTGDLVVLRGAPAVTGDLVVLKVAPAATGDPVVLRVAPAVIVVPMDNHRLTWAVCSTSSTRIATVRSVVRNSNY